MEFSLEVLSVCFCLHKYFFLGIDNHRHHHHYHNKITITATTATIKLIIVIVSIVNYVQRPSLSSSLKFYYFSLCYSTHFNTVSFCSLFLAIILFLPFSFLFFDTCSFSITLHLILFLLPSFKLHITILPSRLLFICFLFYLLIHHRLFPLTFFLHTFPSEPPFSCCVADFLASFT